MKSKFGYQNGESKVRNYDDDDDERQWATGPMVMLQLQIDGIVQKYKRKKSNKKKAKMKKNKVSEFDVQNQI